MVRFAHESAGAKDLAFDTDCLGEVMADLAEVLAIALHAQWYGYGATWDRVMPVHQERYRRRARAALRALEEAGYRVVPIDPTREMFAAGCAVIKDAGGSRGLIGAWRDMCDAAPKVTT